MDNLRHIEGYRVRSWIGEEMDRAVGLAECPLCGQICEARHQGISARMLRLLAEDKLQKHIAEAHVDQMAAVE